MTVRTLGVLLRNATLSVPTLVAFCCVVLSCSATSEPATGDLKRDLVHADPKIRTQAAILAQKSKRLDLVNLMLENLRHNDGSVRMINRVALRKLTGQDFGYKPYGTIHEREEAIKRWKAWWNEQQLGKSSNHEDASSREVSAFQKESMTTSESAAGESAGEEPQSPGRFRVVKSNEE